MIFLHSFCMTQSYAIAIDYICSLNGHKYLRHSAVLKQYTVDVICIMILRHSISRLRPMSMIFLESFCMTQPYAFTNDFIFIIDQKISRHSLTRRL